jgi:hypothetical protein
MCWAACYMPACQQAMPVPCHVFWLIKRLNALWGVLPLPLPFDNPTRSSTALQRDPSIRQ